MPRLVQLAIKLQLLQVVTTQGFVRVGSVLVLVLLVIMHRFVRVEIIQR